MSYQHIIYEKADRTAYITLNRPEARNAIDTKLQQELMLALSDFDLDPEVWVAIVRGAGRCFCSGRDVRDLGRGQIRTTSRLEYFLDAPINWKPVIAAVHGYCYGYGLSFAAECDAIIATNDATFCIVEPKRGIPAVTIFAQLASSMGTRRASEMLLTGEPLSADDAHRFGFVNHLVSTHEELLPAAEAFAQKILAIPPLTSRAAVQAARTSVYQSETHRSAESLLRNTKYRDWEDFKEGMRAFVEKRPPTFTGR